MVEEARIIQDRDRLREYIARRFGKPAPVDVEPCMDVERYGVCQSCCSDYPVAWIKNRLREQGYFNVKLPIDEEFPGLFIADEEGKAHLLFVHFARSKIFSTMRLPEPIDLTAARVSVIPFCNELY